MLKSYLRLKSRSRQLASDQKSPSGVMLGGVFFRTWKQLLPVFLFANFSIVQFPSANIEAVVRGTCF